MALKFALSVSAVRPTKCLAVRANDGNFLDRNRAEGGTTHRLHILLIAGADARYSQSVERSDRIPDARLGKRYRTLGSRAHLRLTLPFYEIVEPEIKGDERTTGEHGADDDRK
ncbi:MAG: hypothetical protein ABWX81_01890 [Pseudolabrys sp.]